MPDSEEHLKATRDEKSRLVDAKPGVDITTISNVELADLMEKHVKSKGTPAIRNGAWDMMLEAARRLR